MLIFILSPEYKVIINFYLIITDADINKFINIFLMIKFNKKKTIIKDLQDFIFLIISILI